MTKRDSNTVNRNSTPDAAGTQEENLSVGAAGENAIKRRRFLELGLMSLAATGIPHTAKPSVDSRHTTSAGNQSRAVNDLMSKQSDSFETKMGQLKKAWESGDYRLVRSLGDSIRNSAIQAQVTDGDIGKPVVGSTEYGEVSALPQTWKAWANGWKYYKAIGVAESAGIARKAEPVEALLAFPADQVSNLFREIRVAAITNGELKEVTSQVYGVVRRGEEYLCNVMFLADNNGREKRKFLVLYGNPDAELPNYQTDLSVKGEGFKLEIENQYYIAYLSEQTGQLERMLLKREHGTELYAGGPGHGETPCIDWAHDYVTEDNFMKARIQYWGTCPDFEIVKGPICTIVRRWGFPYSALHPIYTPSRLLIDIEYRFYAAQPYFYKIGDMRATKDFIATALRDDEWVFTGQPFNDSLWISTDGKVNLGEIDEANKFNVGGFGYFNRDTKDAFVALYLEHTAAVLPEPLHTGHSMLYYNWHGTTWSRYPLERNQKVSEGAVLHQKNAYTITPFTATEGPAHIEVLRKQLLAQMAVTASAITPGTTAAAAGTRLARPGEAADSEVDKAALWSALRDCKDQQLYISDVNIVELGYIYDLSVNRGIVNVLMTMPHRGRPLSSFFVWGSSSVHRAVSKTIVEALMSISGVNRVVVEQTWYPEWNTNFITGEARKKLGV
ncbi:hypothetical protein [Parapedobacter lycopersici]|uniref:metal-sulfur cluster assembly factor n=1 Tax=Parapedobacter lycopersici TaxID=1864939 RepID=UPI003340FA83